MGDIGNGIPYFDEEMHVQGCALAITRRQRQVLQYLADNEREEDGEIVYDSGQVWLGDDRLAHRTLTTLLQMMALRNPWPGANSLERWRINGTGKKILAAVKGK